MKGGASGFRGWLDWGALGGGVGMCVFVRNLNALPVTGSTKMGPAVSPCQETDCGELSIPVLRPDDGPAPSVGRPA